MKQLIARTFDALVRLNRELPQGSFLWVAAIIVTVTAFYFAARRWRTFYLLLRIVAATLLSLMLLAALLAVAGFSGLVIWAGALCVALTLFVQLPRARRQATLDVLTLAVEKRMPLPPVIKALAADQWFKGRLLRLAGNLESGMPLSAALQADKGLLPRHALGASQMGEATGNLAAAFRQIEASDALSSPLRQALLGHMFYLASLAFFIPVVFGFVTIFILPKFISIFDDFGIELPDVTVQAVRFAYSYTWIGVCLPIFGAAALIYAILCYAEVWSLPTLGSRRFNRSPMLRALALATEARRPLGETLAAFAQIDPRPKAARRLRACADETQGGANWNISLLKHGLIGVQDAALIEAAQRIGNLPWALREAADGNDRRMIYRLEAAMNAISPIVIVVWGAIIFTFVLACFLPLVTLISGLSK
jgi:type II secretory pathway component PulF